MCRHRRKAAGDSLSNKARWLYSTAGLLSNLLHNVAGLALFQQETDTLTLSPSSPLPHASGIFNSSACQALL